MGKATQSKRDDSTFSKTPAQGSAKSGVVVTDKSPTAVYAGKDSNVDDEARERKHGGKVAARHNRRAKGKADGGEVDVGGVKARNRLDKVPGRKRGGRVGADQSPLSSAAKLSGNEGHKTDGVTC